VTKDERGRVWLDPVLADAEWEANTQTDRVPRTGPTAPRALRPTASAAPPPQVVRRLEQLLAEDLEETERHVRELIPHAVAGAAETLRRAGHQVDEDDLVEALSLQADDEDAGIEVLFGLRQIVEVGDGPGLAVDQAKNVGRQVVLAAALAKGGGDAR
jgi:hypothetical protein